jgi:hypothetical protein
MTAGYDGAGLHLSSVAVRGRGVCSGITEEFATEFVKDSVEHSSVNEEDYRGIGRARAAAGAGVQTSRTWAIAAELDGAEDLPVDQVPVE